jgi:hypothetical protein
LGLIVLNLLIQVEVGVAIQGEVFGLIILGSIGDLGKSFTCLYKYSNY